MQVRQRGGEAGYLNRRQAADAQVLSGFASYSFRIIAEELHIFPVEECVFCYAAIATSGKAAQHGAEAGIGRAQQEATVVFLEPEIVGPGCTPILQIKD
ncbi:hypothetical protein BH18ACI4_BH18ACI4_23520 [soil metagenome]